MPSRLWLLQLRSFAEGAAKLTLAMVDVALQLLHCNAAAFTGHHPTSALRCLFLRKQGCGLGRWSNRREVQGSLLVGLRMQLSP